MASSSTKPLIVIVGETASGKSALAIKLARHFNGEIISADSWTVRREVNIGTAKPTANDRLKVCHHLIDEVDPCADFTAAVFKRSAQNTIYDIISRNKLPIMVGGTGLYIDGVIFDYGFLPAGNRNNRRALNKLTIEELNQQVIAAGLSLEGVDTSNKRRLIRLLESGGARPTKTDLRPSTLLLGLLISREELNARIIKRTNTMIAAGLEAEVGRLSQTYGWDCEALKGIGYAQWRPYFEGQQTLDETKTKIIKATQDLAKRQRTWFKRNKSIQWISKQREAVDLATTFLNKHSN